MTLTGAMARTAALPRAAAAGLVAVGLLASAQAACPQEQPNQPAASPSATGTSTPAAPAQASGTDGSVAPADGSSAAATSPSSSAPSQPGDNIAAQLEQKRSETRNELMALSDSINLSDEKLAEIQASIDKVNKTSADVRQALIDSAARRKSLQGQVIASEDKIAALKVKEDGVRSVLRSRRSVLAEVLGALERMGRNPPPALLVTPEDALASVRSAILLGAVVPGMRSEADKLVSNLQALASLESDAAKERDAVTQTIAAGVEEERRMNLLLAENDKLNTKNQQDLDAENAHSRELASKATSLQDLIQKLEGQIGSVRDAAERAKAEEERQRLLSDSDRQKAEDLAKNGVPDKNRIAPAYAFSSLKQKLELPVAGDILRSYGDPDGTGHPARGLTIASDPGAVVTAPADGLVVYAGPFRSYGQLIILNAGDGYHIVMAGMDAVNAQQGKFVFAGEPIATMGGKRVASSTALALETDRPTLYIEFRKDGSPVDSKPWWTVKETGRARNDS